MCDKYVAKFIRYEKKLVACDLIARILVYCLLLNTFSLLLN